MFHLILFSPQSISFIFTWFGCIHITWSFNHIVSFTFQAIPSLEISDLRVSLDKFLILDINYLKLNSGGFTTPCLFILNKKYNSRATKILSTVGVDIPVDCSFNSCQNPNNLKSWRSCSFQGHLTSGWHYASCQLSELPT